MLHFPIILFFIISFFLASFTSVVCFNLTLPHQHPDPESVVQELHRRVNNSVFRRQMLGSIVEEKHSACLTGNPIDDCWRCDPNWNSNRQRLADCGIGFGLGAMGGKGGQIYVVTDSSDSDPVDPKPGTLRYGVIQEEPLWIVFSSNMMIKLRYELIVNSYKTIDGRGANVTLAFNRFGEKLVQRMPRCRRGYIHVVNNDFTSWEMYAIGGSANPTINSQGNRYTAPEDINAKEVTKRVEADEKDWADWNWRTEGDIMVNGAFFVPSGDGLGVQYVKATSVEPKSVGLIDQLTMNAGVFGDPRGSLSDGGHSGGTTSSSTRSSSSSGGSDIFGMIFGGGSTSSPAPPRASSISFATAICWSLLILLACYTSTNHGALL
ncbi:hypothetical protein Droror1_Dr00016782 [Drosera rotundifolia]